MTGFTKRWVLSLLSFAGALAPFRSRAKSQDAMPEPPSLDTVLASFPYEVITTTGAKATDDWTRLKTAGKGWPVVVGNDDNLRMILESLIFQSEQASRTSADILKASETLSMEDLKAWQASDGYGELDEPVGDWPVETQGGDLGLSVANDILTGKPYPKVHIVLVPTHNSWEVPAYLQWGGWNACPPPEYHVAILRSWHERFGAELAGLSGDVLDLQIAKPLRGKEEAMTVAKEQYIYCADIVDQGTNDISTLAATLIEQSWWSFWWD